MSCNCQYCSAKQVAQRARDKMMEAKCKKKLSKKPKAIKRKYLVKNYKKMWTQLKSKYGFRHLGTEKWGEYLLNDVMNTFEKMRTKIDI